MKKKIVAAVIAGMLVMNSAIPAYATPSNKEVNQARDEYAELGAKISGIQQKIDELNVKIEPLVEKVKSNQSEIDSTKKAIDTTEKEVEKTKEDIKKQEGVLGGRLRELYKNGGQTSYLSLIFGAQSLSDLIGKIDSASRLVNIDKDVADQLIENKKDLDQKVTSLQEKNKKLEELNVETKKELANFENLKKEQEKLSEDAKVAQKEFDSKYLSKMERQIISGQVDVINNSNSSIDALKSAVSQLKDLKANQIKSPTVLSEIAPSGSVQAVLNEAYKHLGKPYVFGATGPDSFDCSGFTSYVYRKATGIDITRTTFSQIGVGRPVSRDQLQPGDLVFPHTGHVGIYVGNGNMIHAPHTGDVVKVSPVWKFYAARRVL